MVLPFVSHWSSLVSHFQKTAEWLLIFNFDGTLVRKSLHPSQAALSEPIRRKLRTLSLRDHCAVAVISGLPLSDLRRRVGVRHLIYVGRDGLEIESNGWGFTHPDATRPGRPVAWNKGSAVHWLRRMVSEHAAMLYVGKGPTDEDAFRELEKPCVTIRVGKKKDSAAAYYVQRQSDVSLVLDKLIAVRTEGSKPLAAKRRPPVSVIV